MDRDPTLPLGLATLLLTGCGGGSEPAAVQSGDATADSAELVLAREIVEIQDDITASQRRSDGSPPADTAAG